MGFWSDGSVRSDATCFELNTRQVADGWSDDAVEGVPAPHGERGSRTNDWGKGGGL